MAQPQQQVHRRGSAARRSNPLESGLPDPRPVTDYSVELEKIDGITRLTVTLAQPCVIREPVWPLVDCIDGSKVYPASTTVVDNTTFYQEYDGLFAPSVNFVEVPYQDPQVRNHAGGFVSPGGKWFRAPLV
ncbi:MAG TPA: hypothetical protein VD997_05040 [Phycisphaerales bacterium]|nr:hypothetical protein [Phycisphaerales bacterium]